MFCEEVGATLTLTEPRFACRRSARQDSLGERGAARVTSAPTKAATNSQQRVKVRRRMITGQRIRALFLYQLRPFAP